MSFRDVLSTVMDADIDEDAARALLKEIFAAKKLVWADFTCKGCSQHQRQQVEVPDALGVAKALDLLGNQGKGKPVEKKQIEVTIGLRSLDEMTLDELEAEEAQILAAHPELGGS